jgi:hypothetical protein
VFVSFLSKILEYLRPILSTVEIMPVVLTAQKTSRIRALKLSQPEYGFVHVTDRLLLPILIELFSPLKIKCG